MPEVLNGNLSSFIFRYIFMGFITAVGVNGLNSVLYLSWGQLFINPIRISYYHFSLIYNPYILPHIYKTNLLRLLSLIWPQFCLFPLLNHDGIVWYQQLHTQVINIIFSLFQSFIGFSWLSRMNYKYFFVYKAFTTAWVRNKGDMFAWKSRESAAIIKELLVLPGTPINSVQCGVFLWISITTCLKN